MAVARKGIEGLLEYTKINPSAVVSQMRDYIAGQEKKGQEEKEEIQFITESFSGLVSTFGQSLKDFRVYQEGGGEGKFFEYITSDAKTTTPFYDKGIESISSKSEEFGQDSDEYKIATSLFPNITEKRLTKQKTKLTEEAELYGMEYDVWKTMTRKERKLHRKSFGQTDEEIDANEVDDSDVNDTEIVEKDLNGDSADNGNGDSNEENLEDLGKENKTLLKEEDSSPEVNYEELGYNEDQAKTAQDYIDKDWAPDSNVSKEAYLALGGKYEPKGGWGDDEIIGSDDSSEILKNDSKVDSEFSIPENFSGGESGLNLENVLNVNEGTYIGTDTNLYENVSKVDLNNLENVDVEEFIKKNIGTNLKFE